MDEGGDGAGPAAERIGDLRVGQSAVEAEDECGALTMGESGEGIGQLAGAKLGGFVGSQVEPPQPPQPPMVGVARVDDAAPEVGPMVLDRRPLRVEPHEAVLDEVSGNLWRVDQQDGQPHELWLLPSVEVVEGQLSCIRRRLGREPRLLIDHDRLHYTT